MLERGGDQCQLAELEGAFEKEAGFSVARPADGRVQPFQAPGGELYPLLFGKLEYEKVRF